MIGQHYKIETYTIIFLFIKKWRLLRYHVARQISSANIRNLLRVQTGANLFQLSLNIIYIYM
jgi:hypothetical protein